MHYPNTYPPTNKPSTYFHHTCLSTHVPKRSLSTHLYMPFLHTQSTSAYSENCGKGAAPAQFYCPEVGDPSQIHIYTRNARTRTHGHTTPVCQGTPRRMRIDDHDHHVYTTPSDASEYNREWYGLETAKQLARFPVHKIIKFKVRTGYFSTTRKGYRISKSCN